MTDTNYELSPEIAELMEEKDSFKLAIRGFVAIEDALNACVAIAFPVDVTEEIEWLRSKTRIKLGAAITFMSTESTALVREIATLRNGFAHGKLHELDHESANPYGQPSSR